MKSRRIQQLFDDFLSLLFPRICFHCKSPLVYQEELLCIRCRSDLPETQFHHDMDNPLYQKFVYESKVKFAAAYLFYNRMGVAQSLIHHMKYKNLPHIGLELGRWYGHALLKSDISADCIIPVPLHRKKQALRGFNQSERFAAGLSEVLEIPVNNRSVYRTVHTRTQTKKKKADRWLNVDNVFKVRVPLHLKGKSIILVDDVVTTGATLGMMVDTLAQSGVRSIGILTIATGK